MVNSPFCPHVWFDDSDDVVIHNIMTGYAPAGMKARPWGREMDYNLFEAPGKAAPVPAVKAQKSSGWDRHSIEADPLFVDPANGNYKVRVNSPALALGFRNFPMDQFGVQKPELKALAQTPELPEFQRCHPSSPTSRSNPARVEWRDGPQHQGRK